MDNKWIFSILIWSQLISLVVSINTSSTRPNIVFLVVDDMGWNDVGYHNADILSPNIDKLAYTGVILDQNYVQPLCSPSRSAFMTGYYPFRLGLQHFVIENKQAVCVPLNKTFLPQILKQHGYATHAIGKWHLGFCKWDCTPTYRGFDSFYGYYSSREDYYNKSINHGYDFRNGVRVDQSVGKNYSSYQYGDRIEEVIYKHNTSQQLFMYLPLQSVHEPLEVPQKYYDMYPNIKSHGRRTFSGMVSALDDVVGRLVTALKDKKIYNNTIIFFTSDNGGWVPYHGNNYPLRGGKITIWEGGTRVPGFIHSPKLKNSGVKYDGLMHAVDWMSTIAEAAGISYKDSKSDGISHWSSITSGTPSPRNEFIYNLDYHAIPLQGQSAIRVGDYKLIEGYPGLYDEWYQPEQYVPESQFMDDDGGYEEFINSTVLKGWYTFKGLFNLKDDPNERKNLYKEQPNVVKKLRARMQHYIDKMVPANFPRQKQAADPTHFKGDWSPGWC